MGKPSKGTPADKRLSSNKTGKAARGSRKSGTVAFGGNKAKPFAKGGGRKR